MDWGRLAKAVIARRVELGATTRQALAESSGLSARTLSDIENARRTSYDPATLVRLEQALRWPPGSAQAVLAGDDPPLPQQTPAADHDPTDDVGFVIQRIESGTLPPGQKEAMLRYARDVQRRQRAARDDLSRRQAEERQALTFAVIELETHEGGPDGEPAGSGQPLRAARPTRAGDDLIASEQAQWRP